MSNTRVNLSVQENLKNRVKSKIEYSEMTMSDLAESAFKDFLNQYDEFVECNCGARVHINGLAENDGECPKCEKMIES